MSSFYSTFLKASFLKGSTIDVFIFIHFTFTFLFIVKFSLDTLISLCHNNLIREDALITKNKNKTMTKINKYMNSEQTKMFVELGLKKAENSGDELRVALYTILKGYFETIDFNEYSMPCDEGDLIEHIKLNKNFEPVAEDLSKYEFSQYRKEV